MKITLLLSCFFLVSSARAQLPVIDAASIAKAVAMLAQLKQQVTLLTDQLKETNMIRVLSQDHLDRYHQALTKRGLITSQPLGNTTKAVEKALSNAPGYLDTQQVTDLYRLHAMPDDPLAYDREVLTQSANTIWQTLEALAANGEQIHQSHHELEHFKLEITRNLEPQQMRDVQASLQVLAAREALLTRQALMTLTNMEAVRAAHLLNEKAQRKAVYNTFVGNADWLGDPSRYRVRSFLRMPGQ